MHTFGRPCFSKDLGATRIFSVLHQCKVRILTNNTMLVLLKTDAAIESLDDILSGTVGQINIGFDIYSTLCCAA